ncbi:MAG: DUF2117 domain-containing protein [Methanomicrobiales archaeon]|jgi:hypothetical protein|nr:DUF2117 domain-containing protein [Methanomicrobiales archaeon]
MRGSTGSFIAPTSASREEARVMVVHGPQAFDHGDVDFFLTTCRPNQVIVAGVMARTAAEESGIFHECPGDPPSRIIADLGPMAFLLNHGKTGESGRVFGEIVADRLGDRGLVHAECADKTVYCWGSGDRKLADAIVSATGFSLVYALPTRHVDGTVRSLRGCLPGEPVFVNGIVIGRAVSHEVVLAMVKGELVHKSGLTPKLSGLHRLNAQGVKSLHSAWCKSGMVRTSAPVVHSPCSIPPSSGDVLVVDHCGHGFYQAIGENTCGVLAIGDDTTAICCHICTHLGVPVLGITDGDAEGIVMPGDHSGSLVLIATSERDDDIGAEVVREVPTKGVAWGEFVASVTRYLGARVVPAADYEVVPNRVRDM